MAQGIGRALSPHEGQPQRVVERGVVGHGPQAFFEHAPDVGLTLRGSIEVGEVHVRRHERPLERERRAKFRLGVGDQSPRREERSEVGPILRPIRVGALSVNELGSRAVVSPTRILAERLGPDRRQHAGSLDPDNAHGIGQKRDRRGESRVGRQVLERRHRRTAHERIGVTGRMPHRVGGGRRAAEIGGHAR